MLEWIGFLALIVSGSVLIFAGCASNAVSLGFSGKVSREGVVMIVTGIAVVVSTCVIHFS